MKQCVMIISGLIFWLVVSCNEKPKNQSNHNQISKELEKEVVVLEMEYFGWGCSCAQWITEENKKIFEKAKQSDKSFSDSLFYYVLPSSNSISNPFDLTDDMNNLNFRFTGRFFKKMQYTNEEGEIGPAITFMYDKVELIKE